MVDDVTRRQTMLRFRVFSCDFRVSPRCRDPKDETLRLRSAKVGASTSRPIKAKLKANCADLQAEPQTQRFSRKATRQRGELSCVARSARDARLSPDWVKIFFPFPGPWSLFPCVLPNKYGPSTRFSRSLFPVPRSPISPLDTRMGNMLSFWVTRGNSAQCRVLSVE